MSWFANLGWAEWLALALPPLAIVLFYFLKIRRQTLEVPSTMLWTRTIEDFNTNSFWQRFRNQLLMYLQLLAVALIAAATLRPGCRGTDLGGDRFVILIDNSASMSATDVQPSRLEQVKAEAERIIDNTKPNDVVMVISFSDVATVEQSYTTNKDRLKAVVRAIEQVDRFTDPREALKLATGLSNVGQTSDRESAIDIQVAESLDATAYVLSDGGFAKLPDVLLGKLQLEFQPVGDPTSFRNVGIVSCELTASPELNGPLPLFVRLQNFSMGTETFDLTVELNGQLCDAKPDVTLGSGESTSIILDIAPFTEGVSLPAVVRVAIDTGDHLAKDNEAMAIVAPYEKIKLIVVSADPTHFQKVLTTSKIGEIAEIDFREPSWLESDEFAQESSEHAADVIIFDQCAPASPPNCNAVYFDRAPPAEGWSLSEPQFPAPIVYASRYHPLVANLALADVLLLESRQVSGPIGMTSLIESTFGPIVAIAPRGEFEDLVIGFPLEKPVDQDQVEVVTNWPARPSFPTFFFNLLAYQQRQGPRRVSAPLSPGQPVVLSAGRNAGRQVVIARPNQSQSTLDVGTAGTVTFEDTDLLGLYQRVEGGTRKPVFTVNLSRADESDIRPREAIEVSYRQFVGSTSRREVRRELWPWLVVGALVVLLIEWVIFIRRLRA